MSLTDGTSNGVAASIAFSGSDIYITGYELKAKGQMSQSFAKYWKNDVAINFTDGNSAAYALGIFIKD